MGSWSQGLVDHTSLQLETGDTDRRAVHAGASVTGKPIYVNYDYTVQKGDLSKDLDYVSIGSLYWKLHPPYNENLLNDGGDSFDCRLPTPGTTGSLGAQGDIAVIGTEKISSYVRGVTPAGTYGAGSAITVAAEFDEPVVYADAAAVPALSLNVSGAQRTAAFWNGNNTDTFLFNYTVRDGDNTDSIGYYGTEALSGAITNRTGHAVNLTLPAIDTLSFLGGIALYTPVAVASVSSPTAGGAYGVGQAILVNVTFTEPVTVTGTPLLRLETGATDRNATYHTGSGTPSLLFRYTVQPGDSSDDLDYAGSSALALNGGTIVDEGGEAVSLALPPPGSDGLLAGEPALVVDTEPPEVESVSSPNGTGSHRAGRSIAVNVTFSEDAVVTGTPRIALDTGRAGAHATYHSGSGTPSLLFAYEIVAGDSSDDLNYSRGHKFLTSSGRSPDLQLPVPAAS